MTTPFLQFANARMLFTRRTDRIPNFRDGARVPTEMVVMEVFAKLKLLRNQSAEAGAQELEEQVLSGYICRYAVVPSGTDWLSLGTAWNWDESGLKPEGLNSGQKVETFIGDLSGLPAREGSEMGWTNLDTVVMPFGVGGIGATLRSVAGDPINGTYTFAS